MPNDMYLASEEAMSMTVVNMSNLALTAFGRIVAVAVFHNLHSFYIVTKSSLSMS